MAGGNQVTRTAFLLLLLGACASSIDVKTSGDPDADFSGLETYAWGDRPLLDPGFDAEFVDGIVRGTVDRELAARGFRLVSTGDPDFVVSYSAVLQRKVTRADEEDAATAGYYEREQRDRLRITEKSEEQVDVHEYTEGRLILDMVDPGTHTLLWRGKASDEVFAKDLKLKRRQRVVAALTKMLQELP
jgi:hypothetical protein